MGSSSEPGSYIKSRGDPVPSDTTNPLKPVGVPETVNIVNTPSPEGITVPINENPKTVFPPADTMKPAAPASPPAPAEAAAPSKLN